MMNRIVTFFAMVALLGLFTDRALADNIGANTNASAISDSSTLNFTASSTLTMDASLTGVGTISVQNAVNAVIAFGSTTNTITFLTSGATINLIGTGTLTISGTNASAGFTFGAATGQTLTVNGSVAGAVAANVFIIGNNTLTVSAAATFAGTVSIGGAGAVLDVDAATTVTTLTMTGALNITPANTMVLTLTNAVSVGANTLTVTGSGGGGAEAVNGTITLDNASSQLTTAGADVDDVLGDVTITVSADGATLDANFNSSPVAVNMTAAAGNLTLQVATGKTLTTAIDVNDNTLTVSETGTVSTVTMDTAAGILDVNETMTVTTLAPSASVTADVAAGKTLTVTNGLSFAAHTLTLAGTGTISRVDATTGTITDNGGTTITDLRITPGAGTFTFAGTGATTITTMANSTFANGNILNINKTSSGTVTIASGLNNLFVAGGTERVTVTDGTLLVGSAGSNDDITFTQDGDEITVASGATLTTYGSFTVGADAANVNLDAAAGSTVNLSGTSAQTFTGLADDDFNLLGTVNINGSATYTISDAFNYKFGSVTISDGCGLVNNQPSGEMKFVPASTVTLNGNGIFTVNGQASGTRITVDTTTGADTFTLNRGSSIYLTLKNTALSRSIYISSTGSTAQCDGMNLADSSFIITESWQGPCPGAGGTTTTVVPIEDTVSADGTLTLTTTTDSGSTADVTIDGAPEGETVTVTLQDTNTQNTFKGMAGGDAGAGNGIARTLTVDTALQDGTFSAVVQICFADTDLSSNTLTDEAVGLYVFNDATSQWDLLGSNNLGDSQPTNTVGDYGVFQDGFESGDTCAWAVVDGFSTIAAGELTTYTLDASVATPDSGSVTIDPEQTVYSAGLDVGLTATPASGFEFSNWLINEQGTSISNPLTITMDADTVAVAQIDEVDTVVEQFTLTVGVNEADRGTVDIAPDALTYAAGTEVTLTATPASGFTFGGWSGSVDSTDANTNPLTVTVDSDLDITALFFPEEAALFTLEVTVDSDTSQSGTVAVSPALESYATGTEITLTATPADGFQFAGWSGDATGSDNPLVVTISSNLAIGATFEPATSDDLDETLGDPDNVLDTCGTGAGCGAIGTLTMTLTLMGLASLRRSRRHR